MSPILKLSRHNELREIEFELHYLLSLSVQERFKMMINKSLELKNILKHYENRKITKIIKRT